ncbi:MAG: zeta toxin family protein [Candidatus Cloacimonetes bacterium]|nr:zeta toxin family protein [Candidatus Cloacimonadota bacterium]
MKQVFIISGPNGSGKTTLAKELLKEINLEFVNADEILREINPQNIDRGKIQAGKYFFKRIQELTKNNKSFAIESTLSGKYPNKLISKLKDVGYQIIIIFVFLDNPKMAIHRIKVRINNGGHSIPDDDVIRRFYRSKHNFWRIYKNMVDEWQLFYNGEKDFMQVAVGEKDNYNIIHEDFFNLFLGGVGR